MPVLTCNHASCEFTSVEEGSLSEKLQHLHLLVQTVAGPHGRGESDPGDSCQHGCSQGDSQKVCRCAGHGPDYCCSASCQSLSSRPRNVGTEEIQDTKVKMNVQLQKTNVHAALKNTIKDKASLRENLRSRRRIKRIKKKAVTTTAIPSTPAFIYQ